MNFYAPRSHEKIFYALYTTQRYKVYKLEAVNGWTLEDLEFPHNWNSTRNISALLYSVEIVWYAGVWSSRGCGRLTTVE